MNASINRAAMLMESVVDELSKTLDESGNIANPAGRKMIDRMATSYIAETLEIARQLHGRLLMTCDNNLPADSLDLIQSSIIAGASLRDWNIENRNE